MRVIVFIVIAIVVAVIGYIVKVITKGRMMNSLGREVGDHELTSLNSWMEVHEKEGQQQNTQNPPNR
jgi:archaellin